MHCSEKSPTYGLIRAPLGTKNHLTTKMPMASDPWLRREVQVEVSRPIPVQDRSRRQFLHFDSPSNPVVRRTSDAKTTDCPLSRNHVPSPRDLEVAALLSMSLLYLKLTTGPHSACPLRQYAYQGVDSKTHARPMTYDQSAPPRQVCAPAGLHNSMPPPPMPQTSRFKPAIDRGQAALATSQGRVSGISDTMRPPPTPQRPFSRIPQVPTHRTAEHAGSNRFLLGSAHQTTSTDAKGSTPSGRQRMAFVPGSGNGLR